MKNKIIINNKESEFTPITLTKYLSNQEQKIKSSYMKTDNMDHPSAMCLVKNLALVRKWQGLKERIADWDSYHFQKISEAFRNKDCTCLEYWANISLLEAVDVFNLNGMGWAIPENATKIEINHDYLEISSSGINLHGKTATSKIRQWLTKEQRMIQIIYSIN